MSEMHQAEKTSYEIAEANKIGLRTFLKSERTVQTATKNDSVMK